MELAWTYRRLRMDGLAVDCAASVIKKEDPTCPKAKAYLSTYSVEWHTFFETQHKCVLLVQKMIRAKFGRDGAKHRKVR
jgi:hypothetical protein